MSPDPGLVVIDGSDGVWARVSSYDVTVWPDDIECRDSWTWKLTVAYQDRGKWAVMQGPYCLGADGHLGYEPHRLALRDAMALARELAPKVTVNGMTALEALARHRARHPDGNCDG